MEKNTFVLLAGREFPQIPPAMFSRLFDGGIHDIPTLKWANRKSLISAYFSSTREYTGRLAPNQQTNEKEIVEILCEIISTDMKEIEVAYEYIKSLRKNEVSECISK
jgi:hypothetical protein